MSVCKKDIFSLFHNYRIKYNQKYFIFEGEYDMFPTWHDFYNEDLEKTIKQFLASKKIDNFEIKDFKLLVKGNKILEDKIVTVK